MASNRSNANLDAVHAVSPDSPKQELTALARDGARIQIAVVTAAGRALAVWAQVVDRYAETVGDVLRRRVDGEIDSTELIARVTAATSVHVGELSALPRTAADHFDARLARVPIDN